MAREPVARAPFLKVAWTSGALSVVPMMMMYICGVFRLMLVCASPRLGLPAHSSTLRRCLSTQPVSAIAITTHMHVHLGDFVFRGVLQLWMFKSVASAPAIVCKNHGTAHALLADLHTQITLLPNGKTPITVYGLSCATSAALSSAAAARHGR